MPNLIFPISNSSKCFVETKCDSPLHIKFKPSAPSWKKRELPSQQAYQGQQGKETHLTCQLWNLPHPLLGGCLLWIWVFFSKKMLLLVMIIMEINLGCRCRSCCVRKTGLYIGLSSSRKSVCLSISEEPRWTHQRRVWMSSFEKSFRSLVKRFTRTERTALSMTEKVIGNMSSSTFLVGICVLCYLQSYSIPFVLFVTLLTVLSEDCYCTDHHLLAQVVTKESGNGNLEGQIIRGNKLLSLFNPS